MPVFIWIPVGMAAGSVLFSALNGMKLVWAGIGINEIQRTRGYSTGEGQLTQRENHQFYGVSVDTNSDHDISKGLGILAAKFETDFQPFKNKLFDMTLSEGQLLRSMVSTMMDALRQLEEVKVLYRAVPHDPEVQEMAREAFKRSRRALRPITLLLEQFPKKRVKDNVEKNNHSR